MSAPHCNLHRTTRRPSPSGAVHVPIVELTASASAAWRESGATIVVLPSGDHRSRQACVRLAALHGVSSDRVCLLSEALASDAGGGRAP